SARMMRWNIWSRLRGSATSVDERAEGRRRAVLPPVGHDAERLDEALPAAGERQRHAEVDQLVLAEVTEQRGVELGVDPRVLAGEPVGQAQRHLRPLGQVGRLVV